MKRAPDVQRRMRHGPIQPHEAERERWLAIPLIGALARDRLPLSLLAGVVLFLSVQLLRGIF